MGKHRAVYLTRGKAAALYSVLSETIINNQLLIGEIKWAMENRRWFSTFGCKAFADFVQFNSIQITDEYLVNWNRCRWDI